MVVCLLPAAFGLLCVETAKSENILTKLRPAAFGLLCVETNAALIASGTLTASRLRAAVC